MQAPLFVSESSSDDKRKSIRQCDYLSFCHEQLMGHKDALCLFGHSLGEQDQHLIDALRQAPLKTLCISIYPRSEAFIRFQKNHYTALFADKKLTLRFYNAKTHPLGNTRRDWRLATARNQYSSSDSHYHYCTNGQYVFLQIGRASCRERV